MPMRARTPREEGYEYGVVDEDEEEEYPYEEAEYGEIEEPKKTAEDLLPIPVEVGAEDDRFADLREQLAIEKEKLAEAQEEKALKQEERELKREIRRTKYAPVYEAGEKAKEFGETIAKQTLDVAKKIQGTPEERAVRRERTKKLITKVTKGIDKISTGVMSGGFADKMVGKEAYPQEEYTEAYPYSARPPAPQQPTDFQSLIFGQQKQPQREVRYIEPKEPKRRPKVREKVVVVEKQPQDFHSMIFGSGQPKQQMDIGLGIGEGKQDPLAIAGISGRTDLLGMGGGSFDIFRRPSEYQPPIQPVRRVKRVKPKPKQRKKKSKSKKRRK